MECEILADENIGIHLIKAADNLLQFHEDDIKLHHLSQLYGKGYSDAEWLKFAYENGYIVLSSDQGSKYGGEKLPEICVQFDIKHILYSPGIHDRQQFEKIRGLLSIVPDISDICNSQHLRYQIEYTPTHNFKLVQKEY